MSAFTQAINTRIGQLGVTAGQLVEANGASRAAWTDTKKRENLSFYTLQRVALLLAVPVEALVSRDPATLAAVPVPGWRWLDALLDPEVRADINFDDGRASATLDWAEFEGLYRNQFPATEVPQ